VRRAGLFALRQSIDAVTVTMAEFERALEETRASVTPEMEREYEQIQTHLKQDARSATGIGFIHPGMLKSRAEPE
jgi:transitional endoplasmic reticulum ATPase